MVSPGAWSMFMALGLLAMSSCAATGPWPARPGCTPEAGPTSVLQGRDEMRAQVHFVSPALGGTLEVVARSSGAGVIVVGLAPYGTRVFVVRAEGGELRIEAANTRLEHLALWTFDALRRSFGIANPSEPGHRDATHWDWNGEEVTESIDGEGLRRVFSRGDRQSTVRVDIRKRIGTRVADVRNPWCGYTASVAVAVSVEGTSHD